MTKVYLSVDLDYWCQHRDGGSISSFFRRLKGLGLPACVVPMHHHLLRDLKGRCRGLGLDRVVNVDWHSDLSDFLAETNGELLNEGTWANFVGFRGRGMFEWRYPSKECLSHSTGFCHDYCDPFFKPDAAGWKLAERRKGLPRDLGAIVAIGISASFSWLGDFVIFASVFEGLGISDWAERWASRIRPDGSRQDDGMEKGVGFWSPRLTSLDCVI